MTEETEQGPSESNSESNSQRLNKLKVTLLSSAEGRVLLFGVALALAYIFWLGVKLLFSPEDSQVYIGMTATHLLFGRAAGMAFGYSLALGHATVICVSMTVETIMVLLVYPLFVFSWRHLLVINWLRDTLERTREAAEARKSWVQRYGIIGLFVFVWFPFWMTGPVVGCVIGFLLGLPVWVNLPIVLGGTYIAIFGWAFLLRQVHDRVAAYSPYAAMILVSLLITIVITGHFLHRSFHRHKHKN
jgi:uncharacterized membrane protein